MSGQTLYRFFDADGQLLYVGISMTPWSRFKQHRYEKPWWDDVATITKEGYLTRADVLTAEEKAIKSECPLYNIVHNGFRAPVTGRARRGITSPIAELPVFTTSRISDGKPITGPLCLYYEVDGDPISDEYEWTDIDPYSLLKMWVERHIADGWNPSHADIHWFIWGPSIIEFASESTSGSPHFLRYYTQPIDSSGRTVDLDSLPVFRKRWDAGRTSKGGFIPVATGWQPRAFEPSVSPMWLLRQANGRQPWHRGSTEWKEFAA